MFHRPKRNVLRALKRTKRIPKNQGTVIRVNISPLIPIAQAITAMPVRRDNFTVYVSNQH